MTRPSEARRAARRRFPKPVFDDIGAAGEPGVTAVLRSFAQESARTLAPIGVRDRAGLDARVARRRPGGRRERI
jgi:hypothetical protein